MNADGTYNSNEVETVLKAFPAAAQTDLKIAFDECAAENGNNFKIRCSLIF